MDIAYGGGGRGREAAWGGNGWDEERMKRIKKESGEETETARETRGSTGLDGGRKRNASLREEG